MANTGENFGTAYVEVRVSTDKMKSDFDKAKSDLTKSGKQIESDFKKIRLDWDARFATMKIQDVKKHYELLKNSMNQKLKFNADDKSIEKTVIAMDSARVRIKELQTQTEKANSKFADMAKKMLTIGAAVYIFRRVSRALQDIIDRFTTQEDAEAALQQQLGYTSTALLAYAAAQQKVTRYSDENTIQAMTLLSAFTKDEQQIKLLTQATLDLATAKRMDLASAADLVGKAFGSSTNALSRYGIQVTGAVGSTERLKSLTENVAKLYGGQAATAATTFAGKLERIKNVIGDVKERFGGFFANLLVNWIPGGIKGLEDFKRRLDDINEGAAKNITSSVTWNFAGTSEDDRNELISSWQSSINDVKKQLNKLFDKRDARSISAKDYESQLHILSTQAYTYQKLIDLAKKYKEAATSKELINTPKYITGQIEILKEANQDLVIGSKEYNDNLAQIAKLQKSLDPFSSNKLTNDELKAQNDAIVASEKLNEQKLENERLATAQLKSEYEKKRAIIDNAYQKEIADAKIQRDALIRESENSLKLSTYANPTSIKAVNMQKQKANDEYNKTILEAEQKQKTSLAELEKSHNEEKLAFDQKYIALTKQLEQDNFDQAIKDYSLSISDYESYLNKMLDLKMQQLEEENRLIEKYNKEHPAEQKSLINVPEQKSIGQKEISAQVTDYTQNQKDHASREREKKQRDWEKDNKFLVSSLQDSMNIIQGNFSILWRNVFGEANSVFEQIAQMITSKLATSAIGSLLGMIPGVGSFLQLALSGKASGGAVTAGTAYITGENGRELFVPQTNGYIVPNNQLTSGDNSGVEKRLDTLTQNFRMFRLNMIEGNAGKGSRVEVDVKGKLSNDTIRLSNQKGTKRYNRLRN